jgi:DNA-binding MarR family transcriptional regulator
MTKPPSSKLYDGPLTAHAGFWLRFVSNHVSGAFRQKLAEKGVAVAEWALMRSLYEQGAIAPSHLAVQLGITRGGITKIADKLLARFLVIRIPDAVDGRAHTLSLTAAGRRLVPMLAKLADENDREWFGHLPPETVATLTTMLRDIVDHHQLHAVPIE